MSDFTVVKAITHEQKTKLFSLREEVFVVEQEVSWEEEFDEFEDSSSHFIALDSSGNAIGTARWRNTKKGVKLERFAVAKPWRSQGVGSGLVQAVLDDISLKTVTGTVLYMHAQLDAVSLYEKFGFEKEGDVFSECNILHYTMKRVMGTF